MLGIDLEREAQEKIVGPLRAYILCKEIGTDTWVLIETQLERTDYIYLGQSLPAPLGRARDTRSTSPAAW